MAHTTTLHPLAGRIARAVKDARIYEQTSYSTEERDAIAHGINMTASCLAYALATELGIDFDRDEFLRATR